MIIRNKNGELIEINKYNFTSDYAYYEKIMNIKKDFTKYKNESNKQNKQFSKTNDLIYKFINI
jgi:hypothetical protein